MSRASRARIRVVSAVVGVALLAGACSDDSSSSSSTSTTVPYKADEGVASPAATLRADLTALLQEHVLLVGITTSAKLAGQDPAPATTALDANSAALSGVIERYYGTDVATSFLDAWKRHAAALVAFSDVAASTDKAITDPAKSVITGAQTELATLLNTANPQLTVPDLTESFSGYARSVQSAITAQAKQDPEAPSKLKTAADAAAVPAIFLAAGIVKQKAEDIPGKIDAISAVLRAELVATLQEHTYLAGLVTGTTLGGGNPEGASAALDENSLELSRAIGAVYGDEPARRFLQLWRQHVELFGDFTQAAATNNTTAMDNARSALDTYLRSLGSFLGTENPGLAEEDFTADQREQVDALLDVIVAQAAKDPGQIEKLRAAAAMSPQTALLLATAIAKQFPTKFG